MLPATHQPFLLLLCSPPQYGDIAASYMRYISIVMSMYVLFVSVQHVCVVEHVERYLASRERATGLASSKTLGRNLLCYSRRKIVMVTLRFPVDRLANLRSAIGSIRASERLSLSSPEEDAMRACITSTNIAVFDDFSTRDVSKFRSRSPDKW